jgi:hypothetical protein
MELPPSIFSEEVPRASILIVVLEWYQRVEDLKNLTANRADVSRGYHKDEVVTTNVAHEAPLAHQSFYDVVKDARQNVDDPVALIVTIPVVELLEVI